MDQRQLAAVLDRIGAFAETYRQHYELPGLQVAISDRESLVGEFNLGFANLDAQIPVTAETWFQHGSIGKTFTAICVLKLEGEGLIDLHAPIADQLPWWRLESPFAPITVHHLLSHTSGITEGADATPEQLAEVWAMVRATVVVEPGTTYRYSNLTYKALGQLMEHVTGQTYAEVVSERILRPLSMTQTDPIITQDNWHRMAVPYQERYDDRPRLPGHGVITAPWIETDSADGCLVGSASDLAIFQRMLMNDGAYPGGWILTEDQFARMTTPYVLAEESYDHQSYGYGIFVPDGSARLEQLGTRGVMVGYQVNMDARHDLGYGVVAFTNSMNNMIPVTDHALALLEAAVNGVELPADPVLDERDPGQFAGTYIGRDSDISFSFDGGRLSVDAGDDVWPLSAVPFYGNRYVDDRPGRNLFSYVFHQDDDDLVTHVVRGSEQWSVTGEGLPGDPDPELVPLAGHYRSYNPWQTNFRIVVRGDDIFQQFPWGGEQQLTQDGDAFRAADDETSPDRLWFDWRTDGLVVQVRNDMGASWQRTFTP